MVPKTGTHDKEIGDMMIYDCFPTFRQVFLPWLFIEGRAQKPVAFLWPTYLTRKTVWNSTSSPPKHCQILLYLTQNNTEKNNLSVSCVFLLMFSAPVSTSPKISPAGAVSPTLRRFEILAFCEAGIWDARKRSWMSTAHRLCNGVMR